MIRHRARLTVEEWLSRWPKSMMWEGERVALCAWKLGPDSVEIVIRRRAPDTTEPVYSWFRGPAPIGFERIQQWREHEIRLCPYQDAHPFVDSIDLD